ncbi:MAG: InlB B-repeat-containing protein [bacterium]|nr:InlB B-repeat-containing protein [bacterium]MCM1376338.1 InlB B-repeat-containing protein [Muribaculum sp.]
MDELDLPEELAVYLLRESSELKVEDSEQGSTEQENTGETDNIENPEFTETKKEQDTQSEEGNVSEETLCESIDETAVTDSEDIADTEDEQTLENTQTDRQEETVTISGITWKSEPEYDGSAEGTYTFTVVLPDGYTLAEEVSLPQITVTVKESESGTDFAIQTLLDRIASLPDEEEYLALEPDMEEDEDAYIEWEKKLYEYAEKELAIWEEYEALTVEQQAQMPEEELAKLMAWVELAKTLSDHAVMLADVSEHHGEDDWTALSADTAEEITLSGGKYYLSDNDDDENITMGTITIDGEVTLCLNGQTLTHSGGTGSVIVVSEGATFTLCDCKNDTGCITGGKGHNVGTEQKPMIRGGAIYMYNGTTFNMFGGTIKDNVATNGGGAIYSSGGSDKYSTINIYGGKIINNSAGIAQGGGIYGAFTHMRILGGSIEENTAGTQAGGIYVDGDITISNASIINNRVANTNLGGGIFSSANATFSISGVVNIVGNTGKDGTASNIFFRGGMFFDVTDNLKGSSIGVTAQTPPTPAKPTPVPVAGGGTNPVSGKSYPITSADWSCFFSDKKEYKIVKDGNELFLALPGTCDLSGLDLTAEGAKLEPNFQADITNYEATVGNDVNSIDITATTASGADITIKIGDGAAADMENGKPKTVNLAEGENTIVITVTSGGMSKTYTIKITREVQEVPTNYKVTLNSNGGTGDGLTTYTYGTGAKLPAGWTRTGYTFGGWYDNKDCSGDPVTEISTQDTGDKEYWAKWTPIGYTVSYDGNGSTGGSTANSSHTYGTAKALTANGFTRSCTVTFNPNYMGSSSTDKTVAYTFAGWNTEADGSGTSYDDKASVENLTETNNRTVTLYAQWTPTSVTYTPTRAGYTFAGWYAEASCTGLRADSDGTYTPAGDMITLYAKWAPKSYDVTLHTNGGTGGTDLTSYTCGTVTTLPTDWTKTGYDFAGWYANKDCTKTAVTEIDATATGDKSFWAKWTPTDYNISYDLDGGTVTGNPTEYTIESSAITLVNPTKTGYSFGGWSGTDLTGSNNMSVTISAGSTGDREYKAHWTAADYTVTLNGNGGKGGTSLISYAHGTGATLPTDWTRAGYSFAGWYDNEDCTAGTEVTEILATATGNKEYWAKWTPISYSITYVLDGGTVTGNPASYTIEDSAITLNNPTREGYTFTGWGGTDLTGNNHMSVTIASGSTGNRTYTAHWEVKGYTVTLHTNGGTGGTDLTSYDYGTGAVLPTNWTKTGYVFDGWYDNESCTGTAVSSISVSDTGNKEYWAKWTDNIAPVIGTLSYDYQPKNFWQWLIGKKSLIITVPVTEEGSGADKITYTETPDGGTAKVETATIQNGEAKITVSKNFKGTISITCTDQAGNTSAGVTVGADLGATGIIIEDNAPKIAFKAENAELLPSGEYKTAPQIVVTVADDKDNVISGGIASVSYQINGGSVKTVPHNYTASMVESDSFTIQANEIPASGISADGVVISVTATDNAGNSAMETYTVKVHTHSGTLVPAVDPTCTTAGNKEHYTCTCGKLFSDSGCTNEIVNQSTVVLNALGHYFEGEPYIVSTTKHWRKCSRCSITEQEADHSFDADNKCTVCGYSRAVDPGHTHSGTLVRATDPTCTLPGNIAYYSCSSCGKLFSDSGCTAEITEQETKLDALGHNFNVTDRNQDEHWKKCSRCTEKQQGEPHVYDNDTDTKCNVCGYVRTLPGHTHSGTLVEAETATCTKDGHEAYYTCDCGKWFTDSACANEITDHTSVVVGKLGHNFVGEYLFDTNGHWRLCSRCNAAQTPESHVFDNDNDATCNKCNYQRTIGTHTHSGTLVAATEPTCTTAGNKAYYRCSCGKWFLDSSCTKEVTAQDVTIPAKGHTAVADPAKAATCTETGLSEGSHCSVCGHVIKAQTVTVALGHDYSGNYHYDASGHWKVCSRCGTVSAKQRHNYDNDRDTKCNDCGWVRTISDGDDEQDGQPTPTPTPEPPVPPQPTDTPTPQPPSPTDPSEQPQPTETPEPTEKPSETEKQPEGDGEQTVSAAVDNGKIVISGEPVATGNVEGMADTKTVLKLGNGAVIVTVVCAGQEYTAGVADTLAVANAVLTPEQIQLVNHGETIEIRIDVKDISDQVPEQDKEVIESGIEEYQKEVPGLTLGMYVDISMFIRIGESDWNAITATREPIEIIIGIPEKLQEKGRTYYIIRAHDGVSAFMNDMDDEPSTITVSTDLFSSYAIAYVQTERTGHKCGLCHICPTFLGICYFVWLAIIILIMIAAIILLRKRKEEQETEDAGQ